MNAESRAGASRDRAPQNPSFSEEELTSCIKVLEAIVAQRGLLSCLSSDDRMRLLEAAGRVAFPDRTERRRLAKAFRRREHLDEKGHDEALLEATGIRSARRASIFATPDPLPLPGPEGLPAHEGTAGLDTSVPDALALSPRTLTPSVVPSAAPNPRRPHFHPGPSDPRAESEGSELKRPRKCYVCKTEFSRLHFFYDQLCPPCGDFNYQKRKQTADLRGRVALITGARVKIGYQAAILLLRAGAHVIVTTRFPNDAARRYARERDFSAWAGRLDIHGLDLRLTPSVERFARSLEERHERLDFILHNACQTVRRPPAFYAHLVEGESQPLAALPQEIRPLVAAYHEERRAPGRAHVIGETARLSQAAFLSEDRALDGRVDLFPKGELDADRQQIDLRPQNSWRMQLADVPTIELIEVHLVNAIAPFVLTSKLKPLMQKHRTNDKHIVNVSAMEGQFYREHKTDRHPHTNMAKAALNMLTRTSAADYARSGIFMNSVDTGWVTDEDPAAIAARKQEEHGFHPPLDIVDGAARICDPIFSGLSSGKHAYGLFFKDYLPTDW